jgi:hypothetical protein
MKVLSGAGQTSKWWGQSEFKLVRQLLVYRSHKISVFNVFCCGCAAAQVQSGAGRTGKWWGHQHFDGMDPDMVIFAKGIASGYPFAGAPMLRQRAALLPADPAASALRSMLANVGVAEAALHAASAAASSYRVTLLLAS